MLLTIFLDQLSKQYLISLLAETQQAINILPFFNLVMVWNKGVSFGMFSNAGQLMPFLLILGALLITCFIIDLYTKNPALYNAVSYALICGGAIGNTIDRFLYGAVADFFDFHIGIYHWPAFNIADSCIFIGVALLILESFKKTDHG